MAGKSDSQGLALARTQSMLLGFIHAASPFGAYKVTLDTGLLV